jgi:hypothetical protein
MKLRHIGLILTAFTMGSAQALAARLVHPVTEGAELEIRLRPASGLMCDGSAALGFVPRNGSAVPDPEIRRMPPQYHPVMIFKLRVPPYVTARILRFLSFVPCPTVVEAYENGTFLFRVELRPGVALDVGDWVYTGQVLHRAILNAPEGSTFSAVVEEGLN